MDKDQERLSLTTLLLLTLFLFAFVNVLCLQCIRRLRRRRRELSAANDNEEALDLLEEVKNVQSNHRNYQELADEVVRLRETQTQVRSFVQTLQTKLKEKNASKKELVTQPNRDKLE